MKRQTGMSVPLSTLSPLTIMNEQSDNKLQPTDAPKPGFFQRILTKVDTAMKTKADEQAKNSQCCSGDDKGKGGKCC